MPQSQYVTLVPNVVSTVTLDKDYESVEVVNVTGGFVVYFRTDRQSPTVAGAGSDAVMTAPGAALAVPVPTAGPTQVRLISSGGPQVGVRGLG